MADPVAPYGQGDGVQGATPHGSVRPWGQPAPPGAPRRADGGAGIAGAEVVTPEAVPLDLETATVGSRGLAYLVDLLIWGSGLLALTLAQVVLGSAGFAPGGMALLLVAAFVLQFGYPIGFETLWRGRTPGKAAMRLRVVTDEGAPVGFRHATLRAVVGVLELLGTLGAVAVVASLVSRRGQRLGDLAAGTIVVREAGRSAVVAVERFDAPPGLEGYVSGLDASALGPRDYVTVREALHRLPSMAPAARQRVAAEIARPLAARVSPPPPPGLPPETWLLCLAAALRRPVGPPRGAVPGAGDRDGPPASDPGAGFRPPG